GGLSGWIHREVIVKRKWLTEESFLSGMAICQILPGANVVNLSVYVGLQLRGSIGAVVATLAMMTPPFIVTVFMGMGYAYFQNLNKLHFILGGVAAAGVGMLLVMGITAATRLKNAPAYAVALATFFGLAIMHWPIVPVVVVLSPISIWLAHLSLK